MKVIAVRAMTFFCFWASVTSQTSCVKPAPNNPTSAGENR